MRKERDEILREAIAEEHWRGLSSKKKQVRGREYEAQEHDWDIRKGGDADD